MMGDVNSVRSESWIVIVIVIVLVASLLSRGIEAVVCIVDLV